MNAQIKLNGVRTFSTLQQGIAHALRGGARPIQPAHARYNPNAYLYTASMLYCECIFSRGYTRMIFSSRISI